MTTLRRVYRNNVENIANSEGWNPFGRNRRYGPYTMQCWRRGNQFCWISDDNVEVAGDVVGLEFRDTDYQEVREWLR